MKRPKIALSHHAHYQIKERKLSIQKVKAVVLSPDKVTKQPDNRFLAYKLVKRSDKDYLLIVIYEQTNSRLKIVTTFLTSKLRKYL
ncbi:MAG: DUF4258 domain-containing protein [Candidatus Doudnabacteria bacterium]|nr:DUF4258 domain-containing protein [Candidatus Doudnabacteria bacterium]